ncbi:MAG: ankyrin repeat domain-containing protein [Planctomycetia bacterium]|nr:ankyrin repeat domain-containing protein [Planctomycetia bacterium]
MESQCRRTLEVLLRRGASVEARDKTGMSPLYFAASTHDDDLVRVLVKHGAKVDLRSAVYIDGPESVLKEVCGHPELVDATTSNTELLYDAICAGSVALVEALLERGADANGPHRSGLPFLEQAKYNPELLELLLRHGADPNIRAPAGVPLIVSIAQQDPNHPSIEKLISFGATVDLVTELYLHGPEALDRKLTASTNGVSEEDADVLLQHAIRNRIPTLVRTLLKVGANANSRSREGWSMLRTAVQANPNGHSTTTSEQCEIVETLLQRGADPNPADHPQGLSLLAQAKGKSTWMSGEGTVASSLQLIDANGQKIVRALESFGAKAEDYSKEDESIVAALAERKKGGE